MFEQEIEMEKQESSIVPLMLILALAGVILGSVGYWVLQMQKSLSPEQATAVVTDLLKAPGPVTLHFHTGMVEQTVNEKPKDPHYKLLEKAGLIKIGASKGDKVQVTLTPDGEQVLAKIPEFQKKQDTDGTVAYYVPLARKKLVAITKVDKTGPTLARVEYTWQWDPTVVGDMFDANSKYVKSFNIWETQTLIQKYDSNFYHAEPAKSAVRLVRGDGDKWRVLAE